jgi:hypothetical protein
MSPRAVGDPTQSPRRLTKPARQRSRTRWWLATQCATGVRLATADGNGPGLDGVYLLLGTGEYAQASGRAAGDSSTGPLFDVNELGVRFPIADAQVAAALGTVAVKAGNDAELAQPPPGPCSRSCRRSLNCPSRPR